MIKRDAMTLFVVDPSGNRIGHTEAMIRSKLSWALPVLVFLANSKGTQAGRPRVVVCTYSGVKVAKEKAIANVDVFDDVVQVGVELVSCLRFQGQGWGIGADKCY